MKKFRRSILGKTQEQDVRPEAVNVHLESTSTVLDDLRGQATWEEDWLEQNPGMKVTSAHERKVHLLSDLLGQADGLLALKEVLDSSPALRALMSGGGPDCAEQKIVAEFLHGIHDKLGEGNRFKGETDASGKEIGGALAWEDSRRSSPQALFNHRNSLSEICRGTLDTPPSSVPGMIRALLAREENTFCADCTAKLPTWASVNLGVFLCTQCAGCHRSMGVHISKVLSVQLDQWTEAQVEFMADMGNQLANSFLEYHVPSTWLKPSHLESRDYRESYIKAKYQERRFEFRGHKKPVIKPPPPVEEMTAFERDVSLSGRGGQPSQAMTEYIGLVNIVLVRAKGLVPSGLMGQQYMAVLRIGSQEVSENGNGNPLVVEQIAGDIAGIASLRVFDPREVGAHAVLEEASGTPTISHAPRKVRSRWAKADGNPSWSEKLMLCWDGNMPLNIEMYSGKDHIGQAEIPLRHFLLEDDRTPGAGPGRVDTISHALANILATPTSTTDGKSSACTDGEHGRLESGSGSLGSASLEALSVTTSAVASPVHKTASGGADAELMTAGNGARPSAHPAEANNETVSSVVARNAAELEDYFSFGGSQEGKRRGSGRGGSRPTSLNGTRIFVQPMPPRMSAAAVPSTDGGTDEGSTFGGVDVSDRSNFASYTDDGIKSPYSGQIEELGNGEIFVKLQDRVYDRSSSTSPASGSADASSGPAIMFRAPASTGSLGSIAGMAQRKSLKNMMLGKSTGGLGEVVMGSTGQAGTRPAQGGVVVKLDFVRIEH